MGIYRVIVLNRGENMIDKNLKLTIDYYRKMCIAKVNGHHIKAFYYNMLSKYYDRKHMKKFRR